MVLLFEQVNISKSFGLVVTTFPLHGKGREFEPRTDYLFFDFVFSKFIYLEF